MTSRFSRTVVPLLLGTLALGSGLAAYVSFSLQDALTDIAHAFFGARGTHTIRRWDDWFFIVICALATAGAVGTLFQSTWGRIIALLAFSGSGLWAFVIAAAPESWRGVWFSTWVERWFAALIILFCIGGLGLLSSQRAKNGLRRSEVSA